MVALHGTGCIAGIDGHALEALCHVVVIEVVVYELRNGVIGLDARFALIPAVKRHQRHGAVNNHNGGANGGKAIAPIPGDAVYQL